MKKTISISILVGCLVAAFAIVATASANDGGVNVSVKTSIKASLAASTTASSTGTTTRRQTISSDQLTKLKDRSVQEIDRRIEALNKLTTKIQGMKKVSATSKTSLTTTIQGQITLLNNLKIKINGDVDLATVKTDIQSITKSYRIFALILPQVSVMAAADRLSTTADDLSTLAGKLQTRLNDLKTAGKDVTTLQTTLTDMNAKIADAKVQAQSAISIVSPLVPDNGDKTVMESNTKALKNARNTLKIGAQDLKIAHKANLTIRQGIKKLSGNGTATTTTSTTVTSTTTASTTVTQ